MEIILEFGGFYESLHSENIDSKIEMLELDWESVDYKKTYQSYSIAYLDRVNNELGLDLIYKGLDSPRFYNYRTDRIDVEINERDVQTLFETIEEDFKEWANPQLTSRDGFISFYDGIEGLIEQSKDDTESYALLIELLLEFQIKEGNINDWIYDLEFEIKQTLTDIKQ